MLGYPSAKAYTIPVTPEWHAQDRAQKRKQAATKMKRLELRARARCIERVIEAGRPPTLGVLSGICVPFETWAKTSIVNLEIIGPNAVDALLAGSDEVSLHVDHETGWTVAQRSNFSLRLSKATTGMKVEADIPATPEGEDLASIIEGGMIAGFSFDVLPDSEFREETAGIKARYIRRLALSEISLIITPKAPAYPLVEPVTWQRK